jgi:hypothetical protein
MQWKQRTESGRKYILMTYYQWRLAKRNGEIVQQRRLITSTTKNKWWKPWEYAVECDHGEWEDVEMVVI